MIIRARSASLERHVRFCSSRGRTIGNIEKSIFAGPSVRCHLHKSSELGWRTRETTCSQKYPGLLSFFVGKSRRRDGEGNTIEFCVQTVDHDRTCRRTDLSSYQLVVTMMRGCTTICDAFEPTSFALVQLATRFQFRFRVVPAKMGLGCYSVDQSHSRFTEKSELLFL